MAQGQRQKFSPREQGTARPQPRIHATCFPALPARGTIHRLIRTRPDMSGAVRSWPTDFSEMPFFDPAHAPWTDCLPTRLRNRFAQIGQATSVLFADIEHNQVCTSGGACDIILESICFPFRESSRFLVASVYPLGHRRVFRAGSVAPSISPHLRSVSANYGCYQRSESAHTGSS